MWSRLAVMMKECEDDEFDFTLALVALTTVDQYKCDSRTV